MKNPQDFVLVGKHGDSMNRYDMQILNVFRRDGNTTVINIENFKENGLLKMYT